MKNVILIAVFVILTGLNGLFAQRSRVIPIPVYNYHLTAKNTVFQEQVKLNTPPHHNNREKREMDVEITSSSTAPFPVYATVWVVKAQSSEVLGPFTVYAGNPLSVDIDNDQWGVVIGCNWNIEASVWIE